MKEKLSRNPSGGDGAKTYAFGHLTDNSFHKSRFNIQPKPGKKSVR